MMQEKRVILIKEIEGVLYEVMPKTRFDQVYNSEDYTLTEIVADIKAELEKRASKDAFLKLSKDFDALVADVPEAFNTLKKIVDYINLNEEASALYQALDKKLDKDAISYDLLEKLEHIYSADEIDSMLEAIRASFTNRLNNMIVITNDSTAPVDLPENSLWFQIVDLGTMP